MYYTLKRPAIAMIELIFSIVIMGIVMMSAPLLIDTATKSSTVALQQAAIHEAVSRVSMILTHEWDQNDTNGSCTPPVLHTSGDNQLDMVAGTSRRVGIPMGSMYHTFMCDGINNFNASSSLGIEGAEVDDIDDFIGTSILTEEISGTGGKDYIEKGTVNIDTDIYYSTDVANYSASSFDFDFNPTDTSVTSTSVKTIKVIITSTSTVDELQKQIVLNAFSCNIGGYGFERRTF